MLVSGDASPSAGYRKIPSESVYSGAEILALKYSEVRAVSIPTLCNEAFHFY